MLGRPNFYRQAAIVLVALNVLYQMFLKPLPLIILTPPLYAVEMTDDRG